MSALFRSFSSLLFSQQLETGGASNLVLEPLYYADGRQNPDHPLHGSFPRRPISTRRDSVPRSIGINNYLWAPRAAEHCFCWLERA